jgi:hypothetical protein
MEGTIAGVPAAVKSIRATFHPRDNAPPAPNNPARSGRLIFFAMG